MHRHRPERYSVVEDLAKSSTSAYTTKPGERIMRFRHFALSIPNFWHITKQTPDLTRVGCVVIPTRFVMLSLLQVFASLGGRPAARPKGSEEHNNQVMEILSSNLSDYINSCASRKLVAIMSRNLQKRRHTFEVPG